MSTDSAVRIAASELYRELSEYRSRSARDAQQAGYGNKSYWDYLEERAISYGMLDQSLSDALVGNDGM